MIIKLQKGGYISSRNYDTNLNQSFGNLLSMYKPDPIPDINANTQNILGVIQTNSNIYQNRQRLDLQRDEQALQAQVINLRIKDQENQMLKDNQDNFTKLLTMDDNVFLEADQKKFDESLKTKGYDDETLANTLDFRDTDAVYKMMQHRTAEISNYKNAFTNKQTYTNLTKELENLNKSINIEAVQKMGALDMNALDAYQTDVLNLRNKIERIRYEGVNEITPEDLARLRSYNTQSFIDKPTLENLKKIDEMTKGAKMDKLMSDANYEKMITGIATQTQNDFIKAYPNPTTPQLQAHAENMDRIQNPSKYLVADQKASEPTWQQKEDYKHRLSLEKDDYTTANDIQAAAAKATTSPTGTVDTYINGTTTVEKGVVKGASYNGINNAAIEKLVDTKMGTDGTIALTESQMEKAFTKKGAKEMMTKANIKMSGGLYILQPDNPATPPKGTTPANPVITNKNPQPFTTVPQEGGRLSKFRIQE